MNEYYIFLPLEPYLRQWLVHEHGGREPVRLVRGSVESKRLKLLLDLRPDSLPPDLLANAGALTPVVIPSYPSRDPRTFNYVCPSGIALLCETIRDRFDSDFYEWMSKTHIRFERIDNLIYAWMEMHGIEPTETNWNSIAKRYQRLRGRTYVARCRAAKNQESRAKKCSIS